MLKEKYGNNNTHKYILILTITLTNNTYIIAYFPYFVKDKHRFADKLKYNACKLNFYRVL